MYNDYPTIYESNINFDYIYIIIIAVIILLVLLFTFLSLSKVFKKANRSAISAWIPFYNIWLLVEIANKPKYYFFLSLIPILGIIPINIAIAKSFRKSSLFALGMSFLPFIFLPILAFGKNEYFGINIIAMQRKNITNIDIQIEETKKKEVEIEVHNQKDESLKNINISIGGGVYQKKYTNDLLQVDQKQAITKGSTKSVNPVNQINNTNQNNTDTSILPTNNIDLKQPTTSTSEIKMPNIVNQTNNSQINNNVNQVNTSNQNGINQQQSQIINTQSLVSPNTMINSSNNNQVQSNSNNIKQQNGFVSCPKCGTKVNQTSEKCFLCGQMLN